MVLLWKELMTTNILESGYLPIFPGASTLLKCAAKLDKKLAFSTAKAIKMPTRTICWNSCIRPDLEYAAPVWSPHLKGQIEDVESVQKLALRVCCKSWDVPTKCFSLKTISQVYLKRGLFLHLSFLFNIVKGPYSLPKRAPIELREYHHYSRSHNLTLKVPFAKTNTFTIHSSVTPFAIGMLYLRTLLTL